MKNLFISLLLSFLIIGCSNKTTIPKNGIEPVFDCGGFRITKIGEMKDSVRIIVDISACIDELEIPGSLFLVWDNYEKLLSKHTTDAKGHVELNLPPGGSYAFESRAYPYRPITTAASRYEAGRYYIKMKVSNADARPHGLH